MQNKAVKIIAGGSWRETATPFYAKLKILKIQDMYLLELALFMFKFQAKRLPFNFPDYFKITNAIHAKQARSSTYDNYFLFRYKMIKLRNIFRQYIKYQEAKLWNFISNDIKKSASLKLFKKITKRSYKTNIIFNLSQIHFFFFFFYYLALKIQMGYPLTKRPLVPYRFSQLPWLSCTLRNIVCICIAFLLTFVFLFFVMSVFVLFRWCGN